MYQYHRTKSIQYFPLQHYCGIRSVIPLLDPRLVWKKRKKLNLTDTVFYCRDYKAQSLDKLKKYETNKFMSRVFKIQQRHQIEQYFKKTNFFGKKITLKLFYEIFEKCFKHLITSLLFTFFLKIVYKIFLKYFSSSVQLKNFNPCYSFAFLLMLLNLQTKYGILK